jgi:hypothetical protein
MTPALFVEFGFEALRRPWFGINVARISPRVIFCSRVTLAFFSAEQARCGIAGSYKVGRSRV